MNTFVNNFGLGPFHYIPQFVFIKPEMLLEIAESDTGTQPNFHRFKKDFCCSLSRNFHKRQQTPNVH